jgi:ADP-ribose pyrophosphatase YjhB (NUDIX family)
MPTFVRAIPDGDTHQRLMCPDCGHVDYENPKIVVGSVVSHDDRILLCRRAIAPRDGFWTLPAGYLELGETPHEGARREAREEAEADIEIEGILAMFSISRIGQVQIIFRAGFAYDAKGSAPSFAAGPESREVGLFGWDEIPWHDIAFPSVRWALDAWRVGRGRALGAPATNPPEDSRGTARLPAESLGGIS